MHYSHKSRLIWAVPALALLAGCDQPLDFDLRGNFGNAFNTTDAARMASGHRPDPDNRGVISYPSYQVAVAKRGDSVKEVADRVGINPAELARYNGLSPDDPLRQNEVLALPARVEEPSPATGAHSTGPIQPPSNVDIASLAGGAIDRAQPAPVETVALKPVSQPAAAPAPTAKATDKPQVGIEPIRHKVVRGETAYTISRLYNVSVRALAEWNGLGPDFTIREGQFLLIPVPDAETAQKAAAAAAAAQKTTVPGQGSPTPTPPSAKKPLPQEKTIPAAQPMAKPKTPDLGSSQTKASTSAKMDMPVNGSIIREYKKGKTDGIDVSAASGTPVKAAKEGTVAAITSDADKVPIVVIKHTGGLLTVYANLDGIKVAKGDSVKRGQTIASIRSGKSNYVHFEVRKGFDSVDPMPYLN
ncbi:Murein hydrolase activator NlpD precursor [Thalassovita gelatinovora]|uniref:Murein hydrolase activator NlpD n=1 Tax=Thalassovita gelatinovora TaxID=53501 RepID=A0A0P1FLM6_THAGE|nr:peptidoglycan DD-metalloendopeptidase family protein [Thalassovita gelatinovora]QIZ82339.1 peptidoglycan DD-metalloendopeptidase family protein [Thalassovita gelatinovora]CUH68406.1 Murein hydrolase activator NlpD precursor [Thalassovita gelatinovora]SEQ51256.1 Murein DD-endopeptidase MepM and murein hydrolase activator NlpD, contain LysM domain [Thalassovita gelatinovora]